MDSNPPHGKGVQLGVITLSANAKFAQSTKYKIGVTATVELCGNSAYGWLSNAVAGTW